MSKKTILILVVIVIIGGAYFFIQEKDRLNNAQAMTFFITSENPGTGANLGGLAGADAHCQDLASEVGAGDRTWRAYLSTTAAAGEASVNARDRIGSGPWHNAEGVMIANNVGELHSNANAINKQTGLDEKGQVVNGRGDSPNLHDILTGSNPDGTVAMSENDTTCSDWTSESSNGSAIVGHHDRVGLDDSDAAKSWNSSHGSRGCSLPNLNSTGGGGLVYCFALE